MFWFRDASNHLVIWHRLSSQSVPLRALTVPRFPCFTTFASGAGRGGEWARFETQRDPRSLRNYGSQCLAEKKQRSRIIHEILERTRGSSPFLDPRPIFDPVMRGQRPHFQGIGIFSYLTSQYLQNY